jgi:hypothetical protein
MVESGERFVVYPSPIGRMISTVVLVRPGRTCGGPLAPAQNRRFVIACVGPGPTTTTAEAGLVSGEGDGLASSYPLRMCCVLAVGCGEPKIVMGQPMKLGFVLPTIEGRQNA